MNATALLVLLLGLGLAQSGFSQNSRQVLAGHVPPAVKKLQPVRPLAAGSQLSLAIGLPLRDPQGLTNLLQQIYDPTSPNFRHYLTTEQFTEMFGPSVQDYEAVITFAKDHGLTIVRRHANRMLVELSGSVGDIQKAFQVSLNVYHHPTENRDFFAPDREPSVPAGLRVQQIDGLSNFSRPHPKYKHKPPGSGLTPKAGSGPGGNYMGLDFRAAYAPGVTLTGSGQTVALVQFDGYLASDISAYEALAGLPNIPLQNVLLNGFDGFPTGNGGELEVSLDIEMVVSMAPGLTRVILYEGDPYNFFPNVVLNQIAVDNSARQVSCSWGWKGGPNSTTEQIFLQMAAQGQSFFNASGDNDAFLTGQVDDPSYFGTPSASPNITQVGGTTLTTKGPRGAYVSETVWNWGGGVGSSGGISSYFGIPIWQQGINMTASKGSTTHRNIPDVALTADNVFVIADGGTYYIGVGGTSVAAPLWGAFTALVNQQTAASDNPPVGFLNPALYAIAKGQNYTSDFHDITTGNNKWDGSPNLFSAVPGYDLCTGLGTPIGQNMINALTFGGTPDGILEVSVTPEDGATLVAGRTQNIFVQVTDALSVTNASVSATVNGGTNFVFRNDGLAPDVTANDPVYSGVLGVPNSTNDVTLTFLITAPGKTNRTFSVTYNVVPVPANDNFTNAAKVDPAGGVFLSNNRFATIEKGEPQHAGISSVAGSLWWSWSPATSTNVFLDTTGSDIDTVLAVYTGQNISNLTQIIATNDVGQRQQAYLNFNANAGASYRIAVAGSTSNSLGSFRFAVVPGGSLDTNPPSVVVSSPLSGQWVSNFLLTVTGTANDPQPNATGVKRVVLNVNGHNYEAIGTTNWYYTFGLNFGVNHIKVTAQDVAGNVSSPVLVDVTYVIIDPPNDLFVNAIPLSGNSGSVSAVTTNATKEYNEPFHAGNAGGKSVWWSFQPPADGTLSLSTSNSTFDTLLAVYTGINVSQLTPVASNDDAYPDAPGGFSALTTAVRSNETYSIAVDGFDGASGVADLAYTFTSGSVVTLSVSSAGGGQVSGSSGNVISNSTVSVTAVPDAFFQFDSWTGTFGSTANPLSFVIQSNVTLTANFRPLTFTEDFETGTLNKLGWSSAGNLPWKIETNIVLAGTYSVRSGAITNNQTSSLILTTNFLGGPASFYYKVSSEQNYDLFGFYVDGVLQQQWSGEIDWTSFAFPLSSGTHTLEWRYSKDPSLSVGMDAAFIDNVTLPLRLAIDSSSPAHLQMTRQSDGTLQLVVSGQTNQLYVIQGAANLAPPAAWQNLSTNTASGGVIQFVDPGTATNATRYYRAYVPQ